MSGLATIKSSPYEATLPSTANAAGVSLRSDGDTPAVEQGHPANSPAGQTAAEKAQPTAIDQLEKIRETSESLQKRLDEMLAEANAKTSLRFRVDKEAHRVVVSVIDEDSGETIMQIPDERALAAARKLLESGTGLLDQHA